MIARVTPGLWRTGRVAHTCEGSETHACVCGVCVQLSFLDMEAYPTVVDEVTKKPFCKGSEKENAPVQPQSVLPCMQALW